MSYNRWGDIYKHLKKNGIDVYSPAQHQGECLSKYVVIKVSSASQYNQFSTTRNLYDLMLYVPKDEYSKLEDFIGRVKSLMKELSPMIRPMNFQTASYYDDGVKGHMVSIQYYNYRKL